MGGKTTGVANKLFMLGAQLPQTSLFSATQSRVCRGPCAAKRCEGFVPFFSDNPPYSSVAFYNQTRQVDKQFHKQAV